MTTPIAHRIQQLPDIWPQDTVHGSSGRVESPKLQLPRLLYSQCTIATNLLEPYIVISSPPKLC
jgi:hypothetical protein